VVIILVFRRNVLPPSWDGFLETVVTSSLLPPYSELPSKHEHKTQFAQVSSVSISRYSTFCLLCYFTHFFRGNTTVGTLIVATIYLQLIQN